MRPNQQVKTFEMSLMSHLVVDAVDVFVLTVYLVAHVLSHVFQVANDAADRVQILFHLILTSIIGYPVNVKKCVLICQLCN